MPSLRFVKPFFLLLLIIIPLMYFIYRRDEEKRGMLFSSIQAIKDLWQPERITPGGMKLFLRSLVIFFVCLALSGPQMGRYAKRVETEGIDIMLAIDTSRSMNAMDFSIGGGNVTRLEAIKRVVRDFVEQREGDRIGMVVFGEDAFSQCPLTIDYGMLLYYLEKLEVGIAGDATAIGTAIALCVKKLQSIPGKSKIIILLTDGRNNFGRATPSMAAEIASLYGIKVYTIGVGDRDKVPFLVDNAHGKTLAYGEVDLDEETLRKIAGFTGGRYFNAGKTSVLSDIFQEINSIERVKTKVKLFFNGRDIFNYFLFIAFILLIAEVILMNTFFKTVP